MVQAASKTREMYPLSRRKIYKKTLASTISGTLMILSILIGLIVSVISMHVSIVFLSSITIILFIILVLNVTFSYLYQKWYYDSYYYDLNEDYIVIRKGPVTPREITIPYERVQDVYVDQDIFDRLFSIYDVHLSSATISSGMEAHIDGVEKTAADGLREFLLRMVSEKISKSKPPVSPVIGIPPVPVMPTV
jgi:membrane protein YdbS with pleckstrin-like domain